MIHCASDIYLFEVVKQRIILIEFFSEVTNVSNVNNTYSLVMKSAFFPTISTLHSEHHKYHSEHVYAFACIQKANYAYVLTTTTFFPPIYY